VVANAGGFQVTLAIGNPLGLQSSVTEGIVSALGRTVNEDNGVGFAIPSNTVREVACQLISKGKVTNSHRAWLGVEVAATTSGGLLVTKVEPGGPAARAGIRAGELITAVDGTATADPAALADVLAGLDPGQAVTVAVARPNGAGQTLRVALGQFPG
jgi:putative serine protease PepD